jgi:CubicO group peptidase (beta-lactamase class C family)
MPSGLKSAEDLLDWAKICRAIEDQTPVAPPGASVVYHAVTFGWIVGEVLRRVDGRPFARMLREEIAEPLGAPDLYVGLPPALDDRMAELDEIFEPGRTFPPKDDPTPREVAAFMVPLHRWMNLPEGRRACVPASNGIAMARALARHYAALVPGGVDGVELLPPSRVKLATVPIVATTDPENGNPKRIALGYFTGDGPANMGSRPSIFGHAGYGGAMGFADPEMGLAVGFTKNLYSAKGASGTIFQAVRSALGIPQ